MNPSRNKTRSRKRRLIALAGASVALAACGLIGGPFDGQSDAILVYERGPTVATPRELGQLRFVLDDMGGLSTQTLETVAMPWKLATTALLLQHSAATGTPLDVTKLPELLHRFGFVTPDRIANWIGPEPQPPIGGPIGIVRGQVEGTLPRLQLDVANLGCAACHAGATYDRHGNPQNEVWVGSPNTSLNLEAYSTALYRALQTAISDREQLLAMVAVVYPETTTEEMATLREFVLPRLTKRLEDLAAGIDQPLPFHNGAGGLTNGVAALKYQLGLLPINRSAQEFGFVSVPDIGGTRWRSSLLIDGFYGLPGKSRFESVDRSEEASGRIRQFAPIISFFTVPALGVSPHRALSLLPRSREILAFVAAYEPPRFPAPVTSTKTARGQSLYRTHCAACHGTYSDDLARPQLLEFPNRLVPQAKIGTDPMRSQAADATLETAIGQSDFGELITAKQTGGYVGPVLSGLWATAPYLHNGSVPTLWHLMHPDARPAAFFVGGHRLDLNRVGIDGIVDPDGVLTYPANYRPWAMPTLYDTREPGRANNGHERPFDVLSEADKEALLDYLKLL